MKRFAVWFAWGVLAICLVVLYSGDWQVMSSSRAVEVPTGEGIVLNGTYWPGRLPGGVLMLEGFGSDQTALRTAAVEFSRAGLSVFTFDFSGHGRSPGTLGFDNARTDRLARQTLDALDTFKRLSGLLDDRIVVLGHSLGGRVALQSAVIGNLRLGGLALVGAQVNLGGNRQAEFFTGTGDSDLDWVMALGPQTPPSPVLILSGAWDDILTPQAAQALLCRLSGPGCPQMAGREWVLFPALLHNYEPFSPRVLAQARVWIGEQLSLPLAGQDETAARRIWAWAIGFAALLVSALATRTWANARFPAPVEEDGPRIVSPRKFLLGRLGLWVPAILPGALIGGALFFLPFGAPVINLLYALFLGGAGVLLPALYLTGKMPGVQGRLRLKRASGGHLAAAAGVAVAVLAAAALYARSGWAYVYPLNLRMFWLAAFTLVSLPGLWIGLRESAWLRRDVPDRPWPAVWRPLIGLAPFFLYAVGLAVLGSLSGLTGSLQGLLVLWLAGILGEITCRISGRAWFGALCQALLIYLLLLPQGVLFH